MHMIKIMSAILSTLFQQSRTNDLCAGETVFRNGEPVERVYLVIAGRVHLQRHTPNGVHLTLQDARPNAVLAEASVFSEKYHCDAVVVESARLATLPRAEFLSALRGDSDMALAWSAMLARSVQAARVRSEIRSLPTVAERLNAWFGEGNRLPHRGHWQEVAAEIGVTREALYRELARRRK